MRTHFPESQYFEPINDPAITQRGFTPFLKSSTIWPNTKYWRRRDRFLRRQFTKRIVWSKESSLSLLRLETDPAEIIALKVAR